MNKVLFIGDMHFYHANAINFDNRPFSTVEEMNAEMIRRWNNKADKGDLVYVVGDMIWKSGSEEACKILEQLNGRKILIKGNHDRFIKNAKAKKMFEAVKDMDDICVTLEDGTKRRVILSHHSMLFYDGSRYGAIHLYAHTHDSWEAKMEKLFVKFLHMKGHRIEMYNVGCMHWDFEPVTLDEILATGEGGFLKNGRPDLPNIAR